jgi:signal transduction histidine kinase
MNVDAPEKLALDYEQALEACLRDADQNAINLAYRFGHRALESGLGVLDFVNLHFHALRNLVSEEREARLDFDWSSQAQFLIEALAPFEMVHRGFKEANEALPKVNEELDQRVKERTADLEAATDELQKHRNEFIAMVGHEFKNPLSVIKGVAATAAGSRRPLDVQESQEAFQTIDEQADKLRDLVDNLLDITRVEAGTLSINREPLDIHRLIDEATRYLGYTGDRHEVRLNMTKALPPVNGDKRRIGQVLSNLLSNAAKFSDDSAPIDVSVLKDGEHVQIEVRDSGLGIPPERRGELFQKFSQIHPGMKHKGTGLGLAICKGIVEAHGGRIWAESAGEGKGAAFLFTLPIARSADSPAPT